MNEQTLLRQFPRIEGEVVIPDKKEGVLIQPAGRQWRYFHEVILRWLGTIVIIGTLAALLAAYAAGTDPHFGGTVRSQEAIDLEWFKQGGGFIRSKHPPARRFNAGDKLVFWLALSAGVAVSASGYLLLFPFYATSIIGMQIPNVIHSVGAILFIAL